MHEIFPFCIRPVRVIRFLSADTIEEGIYAIAQDKLQLEKDLTAAGTNCIKTCLPGKLILSERKGLREVIFS